MKARSTLRFGGRHWENVCVPTTLRVRQAEARLPIRCWCQVIMHCCVEFRSRISLLLTLYGPIADVLSESDLQLLAESGIRDLYCQSVASDFPAEEYSCEAQAARLQALWPGALPNLPSEGGGRTLKAHHCGARGAFLAGWAGVPSRVSKATYNL